MPSAVFRASWHFLSEASCAGGRAADKKAKPPIKRQILGSPDVLGVGCCIGNCFFCSHRTTESRLGLAHSMKSQSNCFWTLWDRGTTFLNSFWPKTHPFRVEMTQGICGCWLFSQISLRAARPPTIRQPPLKNARGRWEKWVKSTRVKSCNTCNGQWYELLRRYNFPIIVPVIFWMNFTFQKVSLHSAVSSTPSTWYCLEPPLACGSMLCYQWGCTWHRNFWIVVVVC